MAWLLELWRIALIVTGALSIAAGVATVFVYLRRTRVSLWLIAKYAWARVLRRPVVDADKDIAEWHAVHVIPAAISHVGLIAGAMYEVLIRFRDVLTWRTPLYTVCFALSGFAINELLKHRKDWG